MNTQVGQDPSQIATTAASVCNFFLSSGWQENMAIDQMKLQKLVFYAHAWYLASHDSPLFSEDIEAWPWGPVVRPIYYQTRKFGRAPITTRLTELRVDPSSPMRASFVDPDVTDTSVKQFLERVWDVHKPYTGIQLSNSTHAEGEPWTIIKARYGSLEAKPIIPNDLIAAVYRQKLQEANPVR